MPRLHINRDDFRGSDFQYDGPGTSRSFNQTRRDNGNNFNQVANQLRDALGDATTTYGNGYRSYGQHSSRRHLSGESSEDGIRSTSRCSDGDGVFTVDSGLESTPSSLYASTDDLCSSSTVVAPKKKRASRSGKQTVTLLGNIFPIEVGSKIVYRYDVEVFLNVQNHRRFESVTLTKMKGLRDDSAYSSRKQFSVAALQIAFEKYRIMDDGEAFVYDGMSILFSSQCLENQLNPYCGKLDCDWTDIPKYAQKQLENIVDKNVTGVSIDIKPCKDTAYKFNIADYAAAQSNRNMSTLDRSWKQFFNMLTNQYAITHDFVLFGAGKLFAHNSERSSYGNGIEVVQGADKGIKFIEGSGNNKSNVVPALTLDAKAGLFFKSQSLVQTIDELCNPRNHGFNNRGGRGGYRGGRGGGGVHQGYSRPSVVSFFGHDGRPSGTWENVNNYIRGLRLTFVAGRKEKSFLSIGLTKTRIADVTEEFRGEKKSVLAKFSHHGDRLNPNYPGVMFGQGRNTVVYPLEMLMIAPNQRVPITRRLDPPRAEKPDVRFRRTETLFSALNLDYGGARNEFLNSFNVRIATEPLRIEALVREAPQIRFIRNDVPGKNGWRTDGRTKYVAPASANLVLIAHTCPRNLAQNVETALRLIVEARGIYVKQWDLVPVDGQNIFAELEKVFKRTKEYIKQMKCENGGSKVLVIFIDDKNNKSHGELKLLERKHQIMSMQLTSFVASQLAGKQMTCSNVVHKLNCKLAGLNHSVIPDMFGTNIWINSAATMVIGYDVAHPAPEQRFVRLKNLPPENPSVVGFSFNGGAQREAFIGDFHFQEGRKEEVTSNILTARMKWMLTTYRKNQKSLPETIVIIRDGVSEGQYRMVMENEMDSIKQAVSEFANAFEVKNWAPKFLLAIVTKRHNVRFYHNDSSGTSNPHMCTVVDDVVTRNDMTEFFMQSHKVIQGTGKSPSYQILIDELDWSMDQIQSFMLALCFDHQICDSPISLPEPVYQADRWATRGRLMYEAYRKYYPLLRLETSEGYDLSPVDFEAMTKRLSYWTTELAEQRVNA